MFRKSKQLVEVTGSSFSRPIRHYLSLANDVVSIPTDEILCPSLFRGQINRTFVPPIEGVPSWLGVWGKGLTNKSLAPEKKVEKKHIQDHSDGDVLLVSMSTSEDQAKRFSSKSAGEGIVVHIDPRYLPLLVDIEDTMQTPKAKIEKEIGSPNVPIYAMKKFVIEGEVEPNPLYISTRDPKVARSIHRFSTQFYRQMAGLLENPAEPLGIKTVPLICAYYEQLSLLYMQHTGTNPLKDAKFSEKFRFIISLKEKNIKENLEKVVEEVSKPKPTCSPSLGR